MSPLTPASEPAEPFSLQMFTGPAATIDHDWDVTACNRVWLTVLPGLRPGNNLIEWIAFDPAAQRLPDWHIAATDVLLLSITEEIRLGTARPQALRMIQARASENPNLAGVFHGLDAGRLADVWRRGVEVAVYENGVHRLRRAVYRFAIMPCIDESDSTPDPSSGILRTIHGLRIS